MAEIGMPMGSGPASQVNKTTNGVFDMGSPYPPPPTQPNTCHCVGVTVAPLATHTKGDPGCLFNYIPKEQVTKWGNCRCGQVRESYSLEFGGEDGREIPHKPGNDVRCRWYGKSKELEGLVEWATGPLTVSSEQAAEEPSASPETHAEWLARHNMVEDPSLPPGHMMSISSAVQGENVSLTFDLNVPPGTGVSSGLWDVVYSGDPGAIHRDVDRTFENEFTMNSSSIPDVDAEVFMKMIAAKQRWEK